MSGSLAEPLNFCRKVTKQFRELIDIPSLDRTLRARMSHVIDLAAASQKFILPDGGLLMDDPELRAMDENMPLRLPHKFLALEFLHADDEYRPDVLTRRILFARELDGFIHLSGCGCETRNDLWVWLPECAISMSDYIDRTQSSNRATIKFRPLAPDAKDPALYPLLLKVLFSFLNALQCSNVKAERNNSERAANKTKSALPFDSYYILTIDRRKDLVGLSGNQTSGAHRSPREHLRRGHIVRPDGRRAFWRNATVVNASGGHGKIEKDYRIRAQDA